MSDALSPEEKMLFEARAALESGDKNHTRDLLTHYFSKGYAITGFTRLGGPAYLLERREVTND